MAWQFKREEQQFETIPEGRHRIRIKSAEKALSKNGNDMLVLQFEVSGYSSILFHYIVFLDDRPEITNRNLTQFFDSFSGIPEGDFNMQNWIGKVGACTVKHEEYQGQMRPRVGYFIHKDKQGDLPNWRSAEGVEVDAEGYMKLGDADVDVPFE